MGWVRPSSCTCHAHPPAAAPAATRGRKKRARRLSTESLLPGCVLGLDPRLYRGRGSDAPDPSTTLPYPRCPSYCYWSRLGIGRLFTNRLSPSAPLHIFTARSGVACLTKCEKIRCRRPSLFSVKFTEEELYCAFIHRPCSQTLLLTRKYVLWRFALVCWSPLTVIVMVLWLSWHSSP